MFQLLYLCKVFEVLLSGEMIEFENKRTQVLVNFMNTLFYLHDTLLGTATAKAVIEHTKNLF